LIENVKFRGNKSRKSATYNFQSTLHDVIGIAWGLTIASPGIAEEVRMDCKQTVTRRSSLKASINAKF
jgi:hypothetical protein